ncbi:MAG: ABC transporter ATP-binding protein [Omnitrophica bacterium RIFCSPHIGHO2_02_FULL_63_14]|nr:MAG: ABC transporter ATP-binding protein [Omnitrophica bacterium RIFCSPHIGHO2_02_FULL_63_14]
MLELKHVYTHYGQVECLKGVSFRVDKGEIVALLGANGAGKSTVLKTISGLVRPSAGEVLFEGHSIAALAPDEIVRKGICHVPEGRKVFQRMTVRENLELGAYTRRDRDGVEKDIEEVFSLFPVLKKRASQKAGTLSGGEQQMLAIGRALASRPSVLLLDEPSLGLAPMLVTAIFRLIDEIHERGKTILLVEQNARMALKVASRAYVLETGQVALEGPVDEVRASDRVRDAYLGGG